MKSEIHKVSVPCPQCGETAHKIVTRGRDREYEDTTDDEFNVVACVGCGLHRLDPRPDLSELETIYPRSYHAYNFRPVFRPSGGGGLLIRFRRAVYARRLRTTLRHLHALPCVDVLDVGCGDGSMLDLYRSLGGRRVRTFGVDFNPKACEAARFAGHRVYCGRFEDLVISGAFQLVNLSYVIEHVADPWRFVRKIHDVLAPGGLMVLETPNIATFEARVFRHHWGGYHIPRHWTLFDPISIRRLGESAGFRARRILFPLAPVHWVWTFHAMAVGRPGLMARLARRVFDPADVFSARPKTLVLLCLFSCFDWAVKLCTGQTSGMMAIFEKVPSGEPAASGERLF